MSTLWIGITALALMNFTFKALGPALLARRETPPRLAAVIDAAGQCLLASLVVVSLLGAKGAAFDTAILAGIAAGITLRLTKTHDLICVLAAALTTAAIRLIT